MYRFALRPLWILSHLLVIVLAVVMINLGFWQLRRLDERKAYNADVRSALAADPVPLEPGARPDRYTRVAVTGTFLPDTEVLVANKAQNGQPGYWLLSALQTDGGVMAVDRGFVERAAVANGALADVGLPAGEVSFVGTVEPSRGGRLATSIGDSGVIEISQVDLTDLSEHWGLDLRPIWVHAETALGEGLTPLPSPELSDGPHLSYAVQWFTFTAIALIGYPLMLRRAARNRAEGDAGDVPADLPGDGPRGAGGDPQPMGAGIGPPEERRE